MEPFARKNAESRSKMWQLLSTLRPQKFTYSGPGATGGVFDWEYTEVTEKATECTEQKRFFSEPLGVFGFFGEFRVRFYQRN
jgi:hypothetical protein